MTDPEAPSESCRTANRQPCKQPAGTLTAETASPAVGSPCKYAMDYVDLRLDIDDAWEFMESGVSCAWCATILKE